MSTRGSATTTERAPAHPGLLAELMTNTLDQDYQVAADKAKDRPSGTRRAGGPVAVVAILLFGAMIGISAMRTQQERPVVQAERDQLVSQIHERQDRLDEMHARLGTLETSVAALQSRTSAAGALERQTQATLTETAGIAGASEVSGPGIEIVADDAVGSAGGAEGGVILDTDMQTLVNALWMAGAEAVSINGHRLSSLSAIRFAGEAITVDYRSLTPPYTIDAIGDPDTLPARLLETPGGQAWMGLKANYGIRFDTTPASSLVLPADPSTQLRHARAVSAR